MPTSFATYQYQFYLCFISVKREPHSLVYAFQNVNETYVWHFTLTSNRTLESGEQGWVGGQGTANRRDTGDSEVGPAQTTTSCGVANTVLRILDLQRHCQQRHLKVLATFCLPENHKCNKCHDICQLPWQDFRCQDVLQCYIFQEKIIFLRTEYNDIHKSHGIYYVVVKKHNNTWFFLRIDKLPPENIMYSHFFF